MSLFPATSPSAVFPHDDARSARAALDPDVVHQAFDDLDAPPPLPGRPELRGDLGRLEPRRVESPARVRHVDLQVRPPVRVALRADAELDVDFPVRRLAV